MVFGVIKPGTIYNEFLAHEDRAAAVSLFASVTLSTRLRLCRLMCGRPLAFRPPQYSNRAAPCSRSQGVAPKNSNDSPEGQSPSAHDPWVASVVNVFIEPHLPLRQVRPDVLSQRPGFLVPT
jgi:hypothetical protein